MASKKEKLRLRLRQALEAARPTVISELGAAQLRRAVGDSSDRLWRELLWECGVPLAPLLEGVRQQDLRSLERTLLELARLYTLAAAAHDTATQTQCRRLVIAAKDHARLAARNRKADESHRLEKAEMVLWMLTWLENPGIFELWVALRKQNLTAVPRSPLESLPRPASR